MRDPEDNVVPLLRQPDPLPNLARCECGSCWFQARPHQSSHPVVAMTPDGRITAHNARFSCHECGAPFYPGHRGVGAQ